MELGIDRRHFVGLIRISIQLITDEETIQARLQDKGPRISFGIRVLAVAPVAVRTSINRNVWYDPKNLRDLLDKIPLNRLGNPSEIAGMVTFLVSDNASYVTGRTVFVDGGMTDYPSFTHGG